jgi:segregation and condensation protein B
LRGLTTMFLKQVLEAALLAADEPLNVERLQSLFEAPERPSTQAVQTVLEELARECTGRGIELREVASGFRFQVKQEVAPWVCRLWEPRPARYSRALLETLSIIAYRQPVSRGEIEEIRGVTVSTAIIKTLLEHEWVRIVGHREAPGRPALYGTTRRFLDYFGLRSLDELPPLSELVDRSAHAGGGAPESL